jgi:hypothetical protein
MSRKIRLLITALIVVSVFTVGVLSVWSQEGESTPEDRAIKWVSQTGEFAEWLAQYPNWVGYAYQSEGVIYYVEFYNEAQDEWLGYAVVNIETGEISDSFIPRPLAPDVYAEQQERVQRLVLEDPEVLAVLVDPFLWQMYSDYNRYEQTWDIYFGRGTRAWLVRVTLDDYGYSIVEIIDPNQLSEEEALDAARNEAIMLAYTGDGIDRALEGYDNWYTYAENIGGAVWSVEFAADGRELFYALVNIETDEVLETEVGGE